ncbi:MAG: nitrogenase component 1 [Brevinematales bacterium]|jgi:nitrogenase molybdenum-iron protein alpha chain
MSVNLKSAEVEVRERRLKSIISYNGTAKDLCEKSKTQSLNHIGRTFEQCSDCSQGCAETVTYLIKDAAVVVHSPIGCCSNASGYNIQGGIVTKSRGLPSQKVNVICTNIQEKDTVFGGLEKLRTAVNEAYRRFSPAAIFVHSSCAAGIVGDDIEGESNELEKELGIPIVPVFCEGFKSRIWSTGFDAAFHGILRKIVKPPVKKQEDLVNLFNFEGSDSFSPLLGRLGLRTNYVVPLASVETLSRLSEAACTAHICETLAMYIAQGLEQQYGVPEVKAPAPFGIEWTDRWLRDIAKYTHKEDIVEDLIKSEHERVRPAIDEIKEKLKGKKVYIFAGDSFAHSLANVAIDLGLELTGITTLHHDQTTDGNTEGYDTLSHLVKSRGDVKNFSVCNKQPYQVVKILKDLKPDLLIVRHMNMTILGTKLGIPTVLEGDANVSAGYDGVAKLGRRLFEAMQTRKVINNIAMHIEWPYSDWWFGEKNPFYFEGGNN